MRHLLAHSSRGAPRRAGTTRKPGEIGGRPMSLVRLDRRTFLRVSATAAGGLLVTRCYGADEPGTATSPSFRPNGYVRIDADGTVVLWSKNPDMGQGAKTSLAMMIAEELDVDWSAVHVEQAELHRAWYGGQGAGGSDGTTSYGPLGQRAGALARQLLIAAAAKTWGVDPATCETSRGVVHHRRSGRSASYGSLAATAATLPVPTAAPALKSIDRHTIIGTRTRGVDTPKIVVAEPIYGLDARMPGLLHAVVEKCPVHGGRPVSVDATAALAVPGVK